jgi:hypothetical protein
VILRVAVEWSLAETEGVVVQNDGFIRKTICKY